MIDFPDVDPGEPLNVSATLYMTYTRCPDQALGRLRGVYPEESRASFKGGLAHRVFARHLSSGPIPPEDVSRVCKQEIGAALNPKLSALGLKPSELSAVISEVGDLYEQFAKLSSEGFAEAEMFIETEPVPGVNLRGSIDAVFADADGVRLVDWKTGGLYETEQQLGFYAMLWAIERDEIPVLVEAVSIASGERVSSRPTTHSIEHTAGEIVLLVGEMRQAFAKGIEHIARNAGPWCRFCPQLDTCTEGRAAVRVADAN